MSRIITLCKEKGPSKKIVLNAAFVIVCKLFSLNEEQETHSSLNKKRDDSAPYAVKWNFQVLSEILSKSCITSVKDGPQGQQEGTGVYFVPRHSQPDPASFHNLL